MDIEQHRREMTSAFFADLDSFKADLAEINSLYPNDSKRAAEELRRRWKTEE